MLLSMSDYLSISAGLFPIIVALFSIILHEIAHGYAAYIQGDETAYRAGRLTLNPLAHIDLVGSIIVPFMAFFTSGMFFGWAKPVPYNVHNVQGRFGEAFVAAAGVLTNFALALMAIVIFKVLLMQGALTPSFGKALFTIIIVNVSLGVFNLIPVPPFDGIAIIQGLFPRLHIRSSIIYSPMYLVIAILLASVLYSKIAPGIFSFIIRLIS